MGSQSIRHHHSESGTKNKKMHRFLRIVIFVVFIFAVLTFVPYVAHKLIPFWRSIVYYHKINVSSITYILLRFCLMLLPVALLLPAFLYSEYMDKPKLLARCLNVIAFFYVAGMVADIITYNVIGGYVDDGSDPIMLKLLWNNAGGVGIVFCLIQGALYLITSKMLRGHKKTVIIMFAITFAAGIIMPLGYDFIRGEIFSDAWYIWFYKNIYFHISQVFIIIGLLLSATSRRMWGTTFWN